MGEPGPEKLDVHVYAGIEVGVACTVSVEMMEEVVIISSGDDEGGGVHNTCGVSVPPLI